MQTSASVIAPVSGSKKTRVLPVVESALKASFSNVSAIVIRLTPSPPDAGLTDVVDDQVTAKFTLAILVQRARALRAAPTTSLPCLMLFPGVRSEFEKATS